MSEFVESGITYTACCPVPYESLSDIDHQSADDHEFLCSYTYMPKGPILHHYLADAHPTAQSPDCVPETDSEADPEEDDDEDPEGDPIDYLLMEVDAERR
ncbi:hypothetical protein Tco_0085366 [Tanacetum coccineum]